MPSLILPIVGAKYHPPALGILRFLPVGQELEVMPEPNNEHDPNAISVWLDGVEMRANLTDEFLDTLERYGRSFDEIRGDYWHLGYIPRERAAEIHLAGPIRGRFCIGSDGGPRVAFDYESP